MAMKFITSSLSLSMITARDYHLHIEEIPEEQFKEQIYDAYSCVGYQDVADELNVAYNKEPVKARPGDELLIANLQQGKLKYYQVEVQEPRQMNYNTEEEMIEWL